MILTGLSLFSAFKSLEFINILLSIFVSGIGTGGVYLLTISFLQASTRPELRGRVFGNFYSIGRVALLDSFLTTGILANFLDKHFGFIDSFLLGPNFGQKTDFYHSLAVMSKLAKMTI